MEASAAQKSHLASSLAILSVKDVDSLLYGNTLYFKNGKKPFSASDVGALISIHHQPFDPMQTSYGASAQSRGILYHPTSVFFSHTNANTTTFDLFNTAEGVALLKNKIAALKETLDFAQQFLELNTGKKLAVHCIHGRHRSPVLGFAILAELFGHGREEDACTSLLHACVSAQPQLRHGELAFMDLALGRDGNLIKAWGNAYIYTGFFNDFSLQQAENKRLQLKKSLEDHPTLSCEDLSAHKKLCGLVTSARLNGANINGADLSRLNIPEILNLLSQAFGPLNNHQRNLLVAYYTYSVFNDPRRIAAPAAREIATKDGLPGLVGALRSELPNIPDDGTRWIINKNLPLVRKIGAPTAP